MKKLLLITILLGGCASTAPIYEISAYERQEICKAKNIGKYWGNCHMQSVQSDPNYNKVTKHLQEYYPQSHAQNKALLVLNTGLLQQLESGSMTPDEANQQFEDRLKVYRSRSQKEYDLVAKREEEKRQETQLKLQQLSEGLSRASAKLSGNNSVNNQNNRITPPKLQVSYQLKSSFIEYNSKVCVYSYRTYTQSWKTSTLVSCPATKYFANPE